MKRLQATKRAIQVIFFASLLNACAGVDATEDAVEDNGSNEAANAENVGLNENANETNESNENLSENNANNSAGSNNLNGENLGNNNAGSNNLNNNNNLLNEEPTAATDSGASNEFVNNAAGDNFLASEPAAPTGSDDLAAEVNSTEDLGIGGNSAIVGGTQDTGATQAIAPPDTNMGATDTSLAPQAGVSATPATGGTVRYISKNGTSAYDKPNGQVVKNYEQGDHPLVTEDGEWLRTSDGYVPSAAATSRPVPRAKSPKSWR